MDSSLNLLPPERLRSLRREQVARSWIAGLWATLLFVLLNILLLLPSYLYLSNSALAQPSDPSPSDTAADSPVEAELKDLLSYAHEPRASHYVQEILSVRHPGIRLTAFTYTPRSRNTSTKLTLSGDAKTREDLDRYDQALNGVDGVEQARVPKSVYSRDTDLHFTFDIVFKQ